MEQKNQKKGKLENFLLDEVLIKAQESGSAIRTCCENTMNLIEYGVSSGSGSYKTFDVYPDGFVKTWKCKPIVNQSGTVDSIGNETPLVWFKSVLENIKFFKEHDMEVGIEKDSRNVELVDSIDYKRNGKKYVKKNELVLKVIAGDRLVISGSKGRVVLSSDVNSTERVIHLDSIEVYKTGNRLGRKIMRILSCISKGLDVEMRLSAAPLTSEMTNGYNKGITSLKLRKFYEKFGFDSLSVLGDGSTKMYKMSNKKYVDSYYC